MDNTEGINDQRIKPQRPRCPNCKRALTPNRHSRCLWCGMPLPEEFHPSDDDRAKMLEEQKRKLSAKEAERARQEFTTRSGSIFGR